MFTYRQTVLAMISSLICEVDQIFLLPGLQTRYCIWDIHTGLLECIIVSKTSMGEKKPAYSVSPPVRKMRYLKSNIEGQPKNLPLGIEALYEYSCYREFVSLSPSADANSLLPITVDPVDPIVSCSPRSSVDDVTSSDAISVNAAGLGTVLTRVALDRGAAFLFAAFFLPPLRTLVVAFFLMLSLFLTFERFACFLFFCLLLAFTITVSII